MEELSRVALVTGSSGGLGRAIALALARDGFAIAVAARTDDRYPGTIQETVDEIGQQGGRALGFECDLSTEADRAELVPRVAEAFGTPVEVLVNNAAVTTMAPVEMFTARRMTLMFDVQVRAPFELAQHALSGMRELGRGHILNISSPAARHPEVPKGGVGAEVSRRTVYGMCKAALERFTTGLAAEVYEDGIDVNALLPTHIVPTYGATAFFDLAGRTAEPPEATADAASYLISSSSGRVTGRVLDSQGVLASAGETTPRLLE